MKKCLVLILALSFTTLCFADAGALVTGKQLCKIAKGQVESITSNQLRSMIDSDDDFVLLDVRSKPEYDKGNVFEATLLQRGLLEFKITKMVPDADAKIVIYCKSGCRGALAVKRLNEMGYTNVVNLLGGYLAYTK